MDDTTELTCPQCGGYIIRISRRTSDRIISIFGSVRRYRCQYFPCQWEGKLHVNDYSKTKKPETHIIKTKHM